MVKPPSLIKGDKIGLIAPARKITFEEIGRAIEIIKSWDFIPVFNESLFAIYHQFAGNDQLRASDIQYMLDDDEIKAIICVRGGYGSVRIIDLLDFSIFMKQPTITYS